MAKTTGNSADDPDGPGLGTPERIMAAIFVGIIVLCVAAFILLMAGSAGGWLDGALYMLVYYIPFIGLPVALLLMIALTITLAVRRSRASRRP